MKTKKLDLRKEIKELKKSIACKCLDCCCYQPREVLKCEITKCHLFTVRPLTITGLQGLNRKLRKAEAKQ